VLRCDYLFSILRDEHGWQMLVDTREREMQLLQQRADFWQIALPRGFDHDCDSCALGAQHAPPVGASST
jgi:hypothetical protein